MHFQPVLQTVQTWVFGPRFQPPSERIRRFCLIFSVLVLFTLCIIPHCPASPYANQLVNASFFWTVMQLTATVWVIGSMLTAFFVHSFATWMRQFVVRATLVALLMAVLMRYSDVVNDFLAWSSSNRQDLLLIYPALILIWFLSRLVPGQILQVADPHVNLQFRPFGGGCRPAPEILRSARHEAGHALVCSAFDPLPVSFYAEVTSELEQPHGILNVGGHVHCPLDHAESEEGLRLAMLVQLAGG
jgi:hypothetical protein